MPLSSFQALIGTDLYRWWLALRHRRKPIGRYYAADYATLDAPWDQVEFLAVDLETTGLDPKTDAIISIGWVPVIGGAAVMAEADHRLVRPPRPVSDESAVIHGILDEHLQAAPPLAEVMPAFLEALTGRVPIAHHAPVEQAFLGKACRVLYGCPLVVPFVDTLLLERRAYQRRNLEAKGGEMRLNACRDRYGLPRYRAHDALIDALACAELMLAQVAHMDGKRKTRLEELLS